MPDESPSPSPSPENAQSVSRRPVWIVFAAVAAVVLAVWAWRGHRAGIAASITLVTTDRDDLACASDQRFGRYRCEFRSPGVPWPDPPAPADRLVGYYTVEQQLYVIPGLFEQPALAERYASRRVAQARARSAPALRRCLPAEGDRSPAQLSDPLAQDRRLGTPGRGAPWLLFRTATSSSSTVRRPAFNRASSATARSGSARVGAKETIDLTRPNGWSTHLEQDANRRRRRNFARRDRRAGRHEVRADLVLDPLRKGRPGGRASARSGGNRGGRRGPSGSRCWSPWAASRPAAGSRSATRSPAWCAPSASTRGRRCAPARSWSSWTPASSGRSCRRCRRGGTSPRPRPRATRRLEAGGASTKAQLDADEAQLKTVSADARALEAQIEKKTIRAPFGGQAGHPLGQPRPVPEPGNAHHRPGVAGRGLHRLHASPAAGRARAGRHRRPHRAARHAATTNAVRQDRRRRSERRPHHARRQAARVSRCRAAGTRRPGRAAPRHVRQRLGRAARAARSVVFVPATAIMHAPYGDSVFVVEDRRTKRVSP